MKILVLELERLLTITTEKTFNSTFKS